MSICVFDVPGAARVLLDADEEQFEKDNKFSEVCSVEVLCIPVLGLSVSAVMSVVMWLYS